MNPKEEILHYISETTKLYPHLNFIAILNLLHINIDSMHSSNSDEWILGKVKSTFLIIKKDLSK